MDAVLNLMHQEVRVSRGEVYFWLSLASAVDTVDAEEFCELPRIEVEEDEHCWTATVEWPSSIWERKRHVYRFNGARLEHWIEVEGEGTIRELTYLSGTVNGAERGSMPGFGIVYNPTPNFLDKAWTSPADFTAVSAGNVEQLWGSALNGGPLAFVFGEVGGVDWLVAGLEPEPGQYNFHTMAFNKLRPNAQATHDSIVGTQGISLEYAGGEVVHGSWTSPKLIMFAASDPQAGIGAYCDGLREQGLVPAPSGDRADWWSDPIFCTWHEQVALAQQGGRPTLIGREAQERFVDTFSFITEERVEGWIARFAEHDISVGTIILDAKWQIDDGQNRPDPSKFPDLRGFIDRCHKRGQHVILWMDAWEPDGLPDSWCVMLDGKALMADPTHPDYQAHVAKMVARMLGEDNGCYNADGLKIDGTNVLTNARIRTHGGLYGFEFLHAYIKLIYDAALAAKSDAMVTIYSANPYFADCCNVVRLGDLYTYRGDPEHTMRWRAQTIRAGLPHAVLDTDGALRFSMRDDALDLLRLQAQIGVPTLYQAEQLVQMRPFAPNRSRTFSYDDYATIKEILDAYQATRTIKESP